MPKVVKCFLEATPSGELRVFRLKQQSSYRKGNEVPLHQLRGFGDLIPVDQGTKIAIDAHPDPHKPYYQAFTIDVAEGLALAGDCWRCLCIQDVSGLTWHLVEGGVRLRWHWPKGCDLVLVLRQQGNSPGEPEREGTGKETTWKYAGQELDPVKLADYVENGDSVELDIDTNAGPWFVTLRSLVGDGISTGTDDGCQCEIPKQSRVHLDYLVFQENNRLVLEWRVNPLCPAIPFRVQGSPDHLPAAIGSGKTYFPVSGADGNWPQPNAEGIYRWETDFPGNLPNLYTRLFVDTQADKSRLAEGVAVRHPDGVLRPVASRNGRNLLRPPGADFLTNFFTGKPHRILCPYCFEKFGWWQVVDRLADDQEKPLVWWGRRVLAALISGSAAPESLLTAKETNKMLCPRHCITVRKESGVTVDLDRDLFRHPSVHIALCGTLMVGKSHWIFSTIRRLAFGLAFVDKQTQDRVKDMSERIVEKKGRLPRNQEPGDKEIVPPLLFSSAWQHGDRRMVLALCDVDGDSWGKFGKAGKMRYLTSAHGYVLIIDPLQIQSFRNFLADALPEDAPLEDWCQPQTTAITNLLQALRGQEKPPYNTPIAVVVSKADLFREREPRLKAALWDTPIYQKSKGSAVYDLSLHWRVQFAVRDFLQAYDPAIINLIEGNFRHFAYFCAAPVGSAARSQQDEMKFPKFAPWRVEEPLLWLFFQLGMIPGA